MAVHALSDQRGLERGLGVRIALAQPNSGCAGSGAVCQSTASTPSARSASSMRSRSATGESRTPAACVRSTASDYSNSRSSRSSSAPTQGMCMDPARFFDPKTHRPNLAGTIPPARMAEVEGALRLVLNL